MDQLDLAKQVVRTVRKLRAERSSWEAIWHEIETYYNPYYDGCYARTGPPTGQYERPSSLIYDSTHIIAERDFTSLMCSLLTPPNSKWAFLSDADPIEGDEETPRWLERLCDGIFQVLGLREGGWGSANLDFLRFLARLGTAAMWIDELRIRGVRSARFRLIPLNEILIRQNHEGLVDAVYREYWMTARDAFQEDWDTSLLPEKIHKAREQDSDELFSFVQAVFPRGDYDPERQDAKGKPIASYDLAIDGDSGVILAEGGYRVMPCVVARYSRRGRSVYGYSIPMDLMADVKTASQIMQDIITETELAVRPAILTHDDQTLDYDVSPGAQNVGGVSPDGRLLVARMPVGEIGAGERVLEAIRERIKAAYYIPIQPVLADTPRMTATEALKRDENKSQIMAPPLQHLYDEYLSRVLDRVVDILFSLKRIPGDPPQRLLEADLEFAINFDGPLTKLLESREAAGLSVALEIATALANAKQDPAVLDNFHADRTVRGLAKRTPMPISFLSTDEEMAEIRQGRAQAHQVDKAIEAGPSVAALAKVGQAQGAPQ